MKILKTLNKILLLTALVILSCGSDDYGIGNTGIPTNLSFSVVPGSGTDGMITVTYSSSGAINNRIIFRDITDPNAVVTLNNNQYDSSVASASFTDYLSGAGLRNFQAVYYAYGVGSVVDSLVVDFDLVINSPIDPFIIQNLTGGSSKTWKWDKDNAGHLGVGPATDTFPSWYQSQANEKPDCLYDDVITFTKTSSTGANMTLENQGETFIHIDHQQNMVGQQDSEDACFAFNTTGIVPLVKVQGESIYEDGASTKTFINLGDLFFSYGLEAHTYEIISVSSTELYVRTVEIAPDGTPRAWYHRFVSDDVDDCADGFTGNTAGTGNYVLVWEDNFDVDGAPCSNNWGYDIGSGGWGNNEAQYYTDRPDNVTIENGMLKIMAKQEVYNGSNYTSARLNSMDKFEFKYGKVEIRAALPTNGGSWPALWFLGANFPEEGWPACGEIDMMEHVGNNANTIINAIHTPSSFGNTVDVNQTAISDVTQFHLYSIEWSPADIKFYIDGNQSYVYNPSVHDANTWPFDAEMFIIMNVAVGGTLGGTINPNFGTAILQVDYVKVYQK